MPKSLLTTVCCALLAVSNGLAQGTPAPKPGDNGPSLEVTMKFIQDKIAQQGALNYALYSHDSTDNSDAVEQVSAELSDVIASPDSCRIRYHEHVTSRHGWYDTGLGWFDLKRIQDVSVLSLDQAIDLDEAEAGHPARHSRVNPSSWLVRAKRQGTTNQSHENVTRYTKEGNGFNVTVSRSDYGDKYQFRVDFIAPSLENRSLPFQSFDSIHVWGSKQGIAGGIFLPEGTLPLVGGHWKPGDPVQLQFYVAKRFSDSAQGWSLSFCIGSENKGCLPSPNLLDESELGSYDLYFRDEDTANRVAKALVHAVELCGGGSEPEPF